MVRELAASVAVRSKSMQHRIHRGAYELLFFATPKPRTRPGLWKGARGPEGARSPGESPRVEAASAVDTAMELEMKATEGARRGR